MAMKLSVIMSSVYSTHISTSSKDMIYDTVYLSSHINK
jgi:hypothetical protein